MMGELEKLRAENARLRALLTPVPAEFGDLADLPQKLREEISATRTDALEKQLFSIVRANRSVDIDTLLIGLYRRFKVVQTRRFLQNKLYRMALKGLIYAVPRRKGVYSADPISDQPSPEEEIPVSSDALACLDIAP
jgi:hypothetical protein